MTNRLTLLLLILFVAGPTTLFAGGYGSYLFADSYDTESGLFYSAVFQSEVAGLLRSENKKIVDIYIYSPQTEKGTYLFKLQNKSEILSFVFEKSYDTVKHSMTFNAGEGLYSKNNHEVRKRKPKDRLLVETYSEEAQTSTLWSSSKTGENLQRLKSYKNDTDWHVDVRNEKIRFISKTENFVRIENLEW